MKEIYKDNNIYSLIHIQQSKLFNYDNNLIIFKFILFIYLIINNIIIPKYYFKLVKKKKIGVISLRHHQNIGNNLLKYAIFVKLSQYGFEPDIIGTQIPNSNIYFLNKYVQIRIIKKFLDINEKDYDILIVNSDQTWRKWNKDFYDIAFLRFAKNWNIKKFVYGASLGFNIWKFTKKDEIIAKNLLKNFTGISVREKGAIKLIEKNLGIRPTFVLDPTLLIDKKYYLQIFKNHKYNISKYDNYIFVYNLRESTSVSNFIKKVIREFNYKIFSVKISDRENVEKFLYGIYNCKAAITNSYHGTLFSIIFNKPFISFERSNEDSRFNSLKVSLNINERIFKYNEQPDLNLLKKPLHINKNNFNILKKESLNYLKNNLNIA